MFLSGIWKNNKNVINNFDIMTFSETGMAAGSYEYEVRKENDGVVFEYSYAYPEWDSNENTKKKEIIRTVKKSLAVYEELCQLLREYKIWKWDGYHKSNPNVLDGSTFSFRLVESGKTKVKASGSNSSPKNYYQLLEEVRDYTLIDTVEDIEFTGSEYRCLLPEKWIDNIRIRYAQDYAAFFINYEKEEKTLFIIYDVTYGYSDLSDYIPVGKIISDEDIHYIYAKINDCSNIYEKLSDVQKSLLDTLKDDCRSIIQSIEAIDGFQMEID